MARRHRHEEHQNHEAWAIPYGDLITLLLAFFVVMYAISSVNAGKYRVLSDALTAAFRGTPRSPQPIAVGADPRLLSAQLPISEVNRMFTAGLPAHALLPLPQASGTASSGGPRPGSADPRTAPGREDGAAAAGQRQLDLMASEIGAVMQRQIEAQRVRVTRRGNAIEVEISTDILFGSGSAALAPAALAPLGNLAEALRSWPNSIRVEGHTDDRPIDTLAFPSNWELSAARAASVVRLFTQQGVAAQRLAVIGFADQRPVQSNRTPAGRNANRRVVVMILGQETAAARGSPDPAGR
ncbi:MAG: flagellar motor protein MotD [Gammaproteobacteria bacterium]|nr:flagellar motor protein MotD [Gammaproteobacteria bacterium]